MVNTPLTSIGTITIDQLSKGVSLETSTSLRDRINQVMPRYHAEAFDWEMVLPLTPVVNST